MHVNSKLTFLAVATMLLVFVPAQAQAYLGPGLGMGAISVAFGVIGSIFLAIVGIIWYPFKRLLRKMRRAKQDKKPQQDMLSK